MTEKELKEMVSKGESSTLEFKRKISSNEKIAKEFIAFANTIGGYLLVGVDDDGTILGVPSEKTVIDSVETICRFLISPQIFPEIDIVNYKNKDVVAIYINESQEKPHKLVENDNVSKEKNNTAYIRVGEQSLPASKEMTRILRGLNINSDPIVLSIGDRERRLFDFIEKNGKATVNDFSKLVNISRRRAERLLVKLVRAGVLQINVNTGADFFTLVEKVEDNPQHILSF